MGDLKNLETICVEKERKAPDVVDMTEVSHLQGWKRAFDAACVHLGIPMIRSTVEVYGDEWNQLVERGIITEADLRLVAPRQPARLQRGDGALVREMLIPIREPEEGARREQREPQREEGARREREEGARRELREEREKP